MFQDSTASAGYRWKYRFRPQKYEHWVNPVLYAAFEHIRATDKIFKEIEGLDVEADHAPPNSELRQDHHRELELKLILSSNCKGWNLRQNKFAVKNLSNEAWESAYLIGAAPPSALMGASRN